jgi:hypothetical protein
LFSSNSLVETTVRGHHFDAQVLCEQIYQYNEQARRFS